LTNLIIEGKKQGKSEQQIMQELFQGEAPEVEEQPADPESEKRIEEMIKKDMDILTKAFGSTKREDQADETNIEDESIRTPKPEGFNKNKKPGKVNQDKKYQLQDEFEETKDIDSDPEEMGDNSKTQSAGQGEEQEFEEQFYKSFKNFGNL
jgi:hypothetical protein